MKRVVFTGIGIIILASFCVMLFLRFKRDTADQVDISIKNADTEVADVNSLKKPNVPEGWSEEAWEKEFDEELAKEAALWEKELEKNFYDSIDSILAKKRSELSDADLAEIESMLSKFESLESMSESDIIDTLLSFYPEKHRLDGKHQSFTEYYRDLNEGWRQNLIGYYRDLDGLSEPDDPELTKDQKLQFLLYFTQEIVSEERKMQRELAEESRRNEELLMSDPDLYFEIEAAETADTIRDLEESLREAEERGDTESAETWRNHLSIFREITEDDDYYANLVTSIIKGTSEEFFLGDRSLNDNRQAQAREWVTELANEFAQELLSEPSDEFSDDSEIAPPSPLPEKRSVSDTSVSDFEPLLKGVGEKYLDVVLSRYLSEKEFEKFFPSSQYDKEMLKSRTTEMQKTLVSEIRKVMRNMNDVSEATKRQRVKEFVMKNYDKAFAESVLRQLNTDDK